MSFFLSRICLPHLEGGVPIADLAKAERLHRITTCGLAGCSASYCSVEGSLGCIGFFEDECSIVVTGGGAVGLGNVVRAALAADQGRWRPVLPVRDRQDYGDAYCNAADSAAVSTFEASPAHAPAGVASVVHRPEFDLMVSRRSEPAWCRSPCRTANQDSAC